MVKFVFADFSADSCSIMNVEGTQRLFLALEDVIHDVSWALGNGRFNQLKKSIMKVSEAAITLMLMEHLSILCLEPPHTPFCERNALIPIPEWPANWRLIQRRRYQV